MPEPGEDVTGAAAPLIDMPGEQHLWTANPPSLANHLPHLPQSKDPMEMLSQWKRSLNQTLVTIEACPGATDLVADATWEDGSRTFSCIRGYGFGVPQVPLASILGHVKPISRNFETVLKITLHNVLPSLPWAIKWPCLGYSHTHTRTHARTHAHTHTRTHTKVNNIDLLYELSPLSKL